MKYIFWVILTLLSVQSFATTAIICSKTEDAVRNEEDALLHIILLNSDSSEKMDFELFYFGKEKLVTNVSITETFLNLQVKNTGFFQINREDINEANCENHSETSFTVQLIKTNKKVKDFNSCRCYQD